MEIDSSHMLVIRPPDNLNDVFKSCLNLKRIIWSGSYGQMPLDGIQFEPTLISLTALNLDNSRLASSLSGGWFFYYLDRDMPNCYMSTHIRHWQRLSFKHCTWALYGTDDSEVISQELIVKMVLLEHSSLRGLKRDLAGKNVARMKRERPDITFVTE